MTASPTLQPVWQLFNLHLQTLWSPFFRCGPILERQRERLWLADDDFIDLDWAGLHDVETPLVLALRGLTGSLSPRYILGLRHALLECGWTSAALNRRDCLGEPNHLLRGYHSGVSDDLAEVVAHLRARRP